MRTDNELLRAVDDLDAARGVLAGLALSLVLTAIGVLSGFALFGN